MTIVGIVADIRADSLRDVAEMAVYVPVAQRVHNLGTPPELTIVAAVAGDPSNVMRALRPLVAAVDRSVPVSDIQTMDDVVSRSMAKPRFTMALVGGFALVALLLGAVGIYGVMSYVVGQRTRELCIRAALGASSVRITAMVATRAAVLAGSGAAIGIAAALASMRPLRTLLYGVAASDPLTYVGVALLFVVVALAASAGPARRAARVSPASALRGD